MLKGVNKLVVDVPNPNSEFFERAIFFVKPQMKDIPAKELNKSADAIILEQSKQNKYKTAKHGKSLSFSVLVVVGAAGVGAAVTAIVLHLI